MNELAFVIMGDWIPIVYYGTEQGFDGGEDSNNRESLWPFMSTKNPLYKFIQTLAKFRRTLGNDWLQKKQVKEIVLQSVVWRLYKSFCVLKEVGKGGGGGGGGACRDPVSRTTFNQINVSRIFETGQIPLLFSLFLRVTVFFSLYFHASWSNIFPYHVSRINPLVPSKRRLTWKSRSIFFLLRYSDSKNTAKSEKNLATSQNQKWFTLDVILFQLLVATIIKVRVPPFLPPPPPSPINTHNTIIIFTKFGWQCLSCS